MDIHTGTLNRRLALQWDIATWSRALDFWEREVLPSLPENALGLEIGAWNGGLSAYFAQCGCRMVCSDVAPVREEAKVLHRQLQLEHRISYRTMHACDIPYDAGSFDFVVFKSVLGAVGRNNRFPEQQQALKEMHRVLKPGGVLLFAENLVGSDLHQWARKKWMPWGAEWRYVAWQEWPQLLQEFCEVQCRATGFLSAFVPRPVLLKNLLAGLDRLLFFVPPKWRYVAYGCAYKAE